MSSRTCGFKSRLGYCCFQHRLFVLSSPAKHHSRRPRPALPDDGDRASAKQTADSNRIGINSQFAIRNSQFLIRNSKFAIGSACRPGQADRKLKQRLIVSEPRLNLKKTPVSGNPKIAPPSVSPRVHWWYLNQDDQRIGDLTKLKPCFKLQELPCEEILNELDRVGMPWQWAVVGFDDRVFRLAL